MQLQSAEKRPLALYLLFALSLVGLIFSGVYRPPSPSQQRVTPALPRVVKLRTLDAEQRRRLLRVIVPVKTRAERSERLKRDTPFVSTRENPFSGKTTDKRTLRWTRPTDKPGTKGMESSPGSRPDPSRPVPRLSKAELKRMRTKQLPGRLAELQRLSEAEIRRMRGAAPTFQELPQFKNANPELMINLTLDKRYSLGTLAHRHALYFFNMVRKISRTWNQYFPIFPHAMGFFKDGEVLVVFELDIDGKVTSVELAKSYGQHTLDRSCIMAIRESKEFGPIPGEFREKGKMRIPFLFIYRRPTKKYKMFH